MPTPEEEIAAKAAAEAAARNAGGNSGDEAEVKQALLNQQFAERAERAAKAERQKFLDALGLKDEAEFESFVKAKKEAEDKQKSELEKAAEEAARAKAKADKLEAEAKAQLEAAQKRIQDSEIKLIAMQEVKDKEGKVIRPAFRADALDIVLAMIDRKEIKDEDGKLIGIENAVDSLAKEKPFLLAAENQQTQAPRKGSPPPPSKLAQHQNQTPAMTDVVVGRTL